MREHVRIRTHLDVHGQVAVRDVVGHFRLAAQRVLECPDRGQQRSNFVRPSDRDRLVETALRQSAYLADRTGQGRDDLPLDQPHQQAEGESDADHRHPENHPALPVSVAAASAVDPRRLTTANGWPAAAEWHCVHFSVARIGRHRPDHRHVTEGLRDRPRLEALHHLALDVVHVLLAALPDGIRGRDAHLDDVSLALQLGDERLDVRHALAHREHERVA